MIYNNLRFILTRSTSARSYNETIIRPVTRVLHGGRGGGSRGGQSAATSHRSNRSHATSEVSKASVRLKVQTDARPRADRIACARFLAQIALNPNVLKCYGSIIKIGCVTDGKRSFQDGRTMAERDGGSSFVVSPREHQLYRLHVSHFEVFRFSSHS